MLERFPHQLSGGMRQRVMIAIALSCRPRLLIADEPTTALDVTIQAQILALIRDLQRETGTAVIFISHDMGVVAEMADEVAVFRRGEKVEQAPAQALFDAPRHPYTRALLAAVPRLGAMRGREVAVPVAPLLQVEGLTVRFPLRAGLLRRVTHRVHAAEGIGFEIAAGETLALVGESGSGKSTIGKAVQGLIGREAGRIRFQDMEADTLDAAGRKRWKREIQYVFQDPTGSLDPRKTVGFSIAEPILTHGLARGAQEARAMAGALLARVGLEAGHVDRYPHEFSGGQRQRICIARALSCDPKLLIADESVSALDVSVQAAILELLGELQRERGLAYLFITHDMAVVEKIAHRVAVMRMGQIVEIGTRRQVFETPAHPYTRRLLEAVPVPDPARRVHRALIEGEVPSPVRRVDDPPERLRLREIAPHHFAAA
jgi:glutathione transport system ATP-binding protein